MVLFVVDIVRRQAGFNDVKPNALMEKATLKSCKLGSSLCSGPHLLCSAKASVVLQVAIKSSTSSSDTGSVLNE
jgi:hypothetical protein